MRGKERVRDRVRGEGLVSVERVRDDARVREFGEGGVSVRRLGEGERSVPRAWPTLASFSPPGCTRSGHSGATPSPGKIPCAEIRG